MTLQEVTETCREFRSYFPEGITDWRSASVVTDRLAPMMGIDRATYAEAHRKIGPFGTTIAVLCMLEKLSQIRNPGGYLRGLAKRAEAGRLNLRGMVRSLGQSGNLGIVS